MNEDTIEAVKKWIETMEKPKEQERMAEELEKCEVAMVSVYPELEDVLVSYTNNIMSMLGLEKHRSTTRVHQIIKIRQERELRGDVKHYKEL